MQSRRPTRTDVAARAGVAPSTVTLILRDKGDALRIPKSTQERVKEAARSLGYYPNWHIKSVLRGRSGILGLYLRWEQWSKPFGYFNNFVWCIQKAAAEHDVQLLVHNARADAPTEESFARQAGGIVDGVMIINSGIDPIVERIVETRLPAVELGDPYSALPFVAVDAKQVVRLAMGHLLGRGYKRPAVLGYVTSYIANAQSRHDEFVHCAKTMFGIENAAGRIVEAFNAEIGYPHVLALDPKPDCVLCTSDELAYDVLRFCKRDGIRVPEDLAIVGFDALEAFGATRVLTGVHAPLEQMAQLAVKKLIEVVDGRHPEHGTILPATLRIGDTT